MPAAAFGRDALAKRHPRARVSILTFISMINTTCERLKARNFYICQYFSFYEQLKFGAKLS